MNKIRTKFRVGKFFIPVTLIYEQDKIWVHFGFNRKMIDEVKMMEGAKWWGYDEENPKKVWSVKNSPRNQFQIDFLQGKNPYAKYDEPLITDFKSERPLREHQLKEFVPFILTRKQCLLAAEMGTGKTLAAIEVLEKILFTDQMRRDAYHLAWYLGPKSGLKAVEREMIKWNSKVIPRFLTYEALVREMRDWINDTPPPMIVIYDESSKIKNPTAQRSQAAKHLADSIRKYWDTEAFIVLMSGAPAPKAPTDFHNQCEIACPGFLKEGNIYKFKSRLCLIEERKSITGGVYPHIVTWLDDENKCAFCGTYKDDEQHNDILNAKYHDFKKSKNEVAFLYKRMSGLVLVKFKKDCLDLPDIQYEIIKVKPSPEILRVAKVIAKTAPRAINALNLLRELSDGFQYQDIPDGYRKCENCRGTGKSIEPIPDSKLDLQKPDNREYKEKETTCPLCNGTGEVIKYKRITKQVGTPKDQFFIDELDQHEEFGRYIVWGGYTGTVDRLVAIAHKYGWATLRVDGRGFEALEPNNTLIDTDDAFNAMDRSHPDFKNLLERIPKLCFVGHPKAGGMGLTLTGSPTELFYSNSFDGDARIQAIHRFHRIGMDENRGCIVKDLIHLNTDLLVLENLKKKKRLQDISMGELQIYLEKE